MCLFVYLIYKFASTYLYLFLSITTYKTLSSYCVSGQLMQNNYTQVKILGGSKLEYYKLMKGTTQKRGRNFEISVGGSKRKEHDFWLKTGGWENLGGNYGFIFGRIYTKNIYRNYI